MTSRSIHLTAEHEAFLETMLRAGEYPNASEAIGDALSALRRRREAQRMREEDLRAELARGVRALDRGDFTEIADEELDAFLEDLAASR